MIGFSSSSSGRGAARRGGARALRLVAAALRVLLPLLLVLLGRRAFGLQRRGHARLRSARGRDRARGRNGSLCLGVEDGAHDLVALERELGVLGLEREGGLD